MIPMLNICIPPRKQIIATVDAQPPTVLPARREITDHIIPIKLTAAIIKPAAVIMRIGLTEKLNAKRYDIMLVICGADVPKEEADEVYSQLRKAYRRTEIVMIDGGQPIYDYIIILE